ncbi:type II secretion system protein [Shewanella colwelliana]|uniref:type II secretion system protein n=1 Tax=Shewanella colwelliana TaxID=23 RepID=UPI0022AEB06F|nr:prepilin-type N-terminal cleavage/methylation domain-containing protein [Shewanella colwelliana]MCZ4336846.1 prepilin-type N-terminal cleavage/methylation domain-containing protein [Shewanella colwelliana]
MKQQKGFTLVELVVMILVLGIISVIAAPKFLSLSSESQTAMIKSVGGTIASMNQMVNSKTQVVGIADKGDCSYSCGGDPHWDVLVGYYFVDISGTRLYVYNGYPMATQSDPVVQKNYKIVMGLSDDDWLVEPYINGHASGIIPMKFKDKVADIRDGKFQCHLEYVEPSDSQRYALKILTDDC